MSIFNFLFGNDEPTVLERSVRILTSRVNSLENDIAVQRLVFIALEQLLMKLTKEVRGEVLFAATHPHNSAVLSERELNALITLKKVKRNKTMPKKKTGGKRGRTAR